MDAQSRLDDVAALAALVQCLARAEAESAAPPRAPGGAGLVRASPPRATAWRRACSTTTARCGRRESSWPPCWAGSRRRRGSSECEAALAPLGGWEGGAARQRAAVARGERLPAFLAATTT